MPEKPYKQVGLRPLTHAKLVAVANANRWKKGEAVDAILDDYIKRHMPDLITLVSPASSLPTP